MLVRVGFSWGLSEPGSSKGRIEIREIEAAATRQRWWKNKKMKHYRSLARSGSAVPVPAGGKERSKSGERQERKGRVRNRERKSKPQEDGTWNKDGLVSAQFFYPHHTHTKHTNTSAHEGTHYTNRPRGVGKNHSRI